MNDLVEFLRARLNEDEQTAQGARSWCHGGRWSADRSGDIVARVDPEFIRKLSRSARGGRALEFIRLDQPAVVANHIARHDPARVLREVEAKRRIIDDTWGGPDHEDMWLHHLRLLALPYSDHEEFKEEWRV